MPSALKPLWQTRERLPGAVDERKYKHLARGVTPARRELLAVSPNGVAERVRALGTGIPSDGSMMGAG